MRTRTLLVSAFALAGAAMNWACSHSADPVRLSRPPLRSVWPRPPARRTLVRKFVPPRGIAPWRIEPRDSVRWTTPPGQETEALAIGGSADRVIRIPGTFHPASFNRVSCTLINVGRTSFVVRFRRAGEVVAESQTVWKPSGYTPIALTCAFPDNAQETEPFDELELQIGPDGGVTFVFAVGLYYESPGGDAPRAGDEPDLAFLTDDGRQAIGLLAGEEFESNFRAPSSEAGVLSFSFGLSANSGLKPSECKLRFDLVSKGRSAFGIEYTPQVDAWTTKTIDLSDFSGRDVVLSVRFETSRPSEATCLLGELMLLDLDVERPATVLLITSDTHRADHLGSAESGVTIATPAIDTLARRGVFFENCWSSSNHTIPSHTALLTGVHPRDSGVLANRTKVMSRAYTLAESFRTAGYATYAVVSARHLGHSTSGLGQGFDRMAQTDKARSRANRSVRILERWLDESQDKPLFIWLHLFDAHAPYRPPARFAAPYLEALPEPASDVAKNKARYRGEISFLDSELRRLLERPRLRAGIVALTADHGESLGAQGILFEHAEIYPATTHVPLILAWPQAPAGQRVRRDVRQWDVGRTLLDLAGLESTDFPGSSLVAPDPVSDPVFALSSNAQAASIRHDGWLLILNLAEHRVIRGGRLYAEHELELFHVAQDFDCERDVSAREVGRARDLRALLLRWLSKSRQLGWGEPAKIDPDLNEQLAQLGYAGGATKGAAELSVDPDCACERCVPYRD